MNFFIFMVILIFVFITLSTQQNCDESEYRYADSVIAKIITVGSSGRKFPENKGEDLKQYCNDTRTYVKQVTEFKNRCAKQLVKQIFGIILYALDSNINHLCKKDSKRLNDLIESTPCINRASAELNKCYTKYIDALLGAKNALTDTKKMAYNCCGYFQMFPCFESGMKRIRMCTPFHIQTTVDFVKSLFIDVVSLICNEYNEETDKCERLGAPPRKRRNQRRSKSFIIPFIDLLGSFKEV